MKRTFCWVLIIGLLISLEMLGCAKKEKEKEIKIGVILPLTGDLAEPGTKAFNGIKLAIDAYNDTKPEIPISLIVEDSKANPTEGVNAINKLININKVKIVLGDLTSGVTLAIAPIAERHKVVVLAPGASNPKVRNAGDYIFRNWASDNFDGEVMAKYLANKPDKRKAAVIYVNNEYGTELANAFEETFIKNGGSIVLKEKYDQGATDFRSVLAKMKAANFDCVYLPGQPRENGLMIRQLKEMAINTTVTANLSVESPDFYAIAGEGGKGIIFSTPAFDSDTNKKDIKIFVEQYESKFKMKPDAVAGHGYDAANIMIQAIKMAGYDVNEVKDELYKINNFPGVTGITTFDNYGDVVKSVMIKRLSHDGSAVILETYKP